MTSTPHQSGPGFSPGADDDEVTVSRPEPGVTGPIQDGAAELREEAAASRADGMDSRADNPQGGAEASQQAEQTAVLSDSVADDCASGRKRLSDSDPDERGPGRSGD